MKISGDELTIEQRRAIAEVCRPHWGAIGKATDAYGLAIVLGWPRRPHPLLERLRGDAAAPILTPSDEAVRDAIGQGGIPDDRVLDFVRPRAPPRSRLLVAIGEDLFCVDFGGQSMLRAVR